MNLKTKTAIVAIVILVFVGGYVSNGNDFGQSDLDEAFSEGTMSSSGKSLPVDIGDEQPSPYGRYIEVAYFNDSYMDNVTRTEKLPQGEYEYRVLISLTENANGTKMMRMHPIFVRNPEGEKNENVTRLLERVTKIEM